VEPTSGVTEENTPASGRKTKCTVRVCLHGPTVVSTLENIKTIKKTVKAFSSGQMAEDTPVPGKMENSMELGNIERQIMLRKKANGSKDRE